MSALAHPTSLRVRWERQGKEPIATGMTHLTPTCQSATFNRVCYQTIHAIENDMSEVYLRDAENETLDKAQLDLT